MSDVDRIDDALEQISNDDLYKIVCEVAAEVAESSLSDSGIVLSVRTILARYGLYNGGS